MPTGMATKPDGYTTRTGVPEAGQPLLSYHGISSPNRSIGSGHANCTDPCPKNCLNCRSGRTTPIWDSSSQYQCDPCVCCVYRGYSFLPHDDARRVLADDARLTSVPCWLQRGRSARYRGFRIAIAVARRSIPRVRSYSEPITPPVSAHLVQPARTGWTATWIWH
jgi:hypothetical protein